MDQQLKMLELDPKAAIILVSVTPTGNRAISKILPLQNVSEFWQAFFILLDATGATASAMVKDNNLGITDHEHMAQYVSEHITKVIMSATEPEEK